MSGTQEPTGQNLAPATITQPDLDRAKAEGNAAGSSAERDRVRTILQSEAANGRQDMAAHLAFETEMPADSAIALLGKAPALVVKPLGALAAAMAKTDQPNVGGDPDSDAAGQSGNQANAILADFNKATGRTAGRK